MLIDVRDLGWILFFIALIVLLVYLIILVKNSIESVKRVNHILANAEKVTDITGKRAEELDGIVTDVSRAIGDVTSGFKGNETTLKSISSIGSAITAIINLIKKERNNE